VIQVSFYGAAGEVTGSCYLITTPHARILLDFGIHQGDPQAYTRNHTMPPIDPATLDAVVLTHGHLDHCGRLPLLRKHGYEGPIYSTPASCAITGLILRDSASIQQADAEDDNRRLAAQGRPLVEPLYTIEESEQILAQLKPLPYGRRQNIARGISVQFFDAGHIIGSSSVLVTIDADAPSGQPERNLIFSGDIGVRNAPILRDPVPPTTASTAGPDLVVLESTYGDRDHRPFGPTIEELAGIIQTAHRENGKILIPAFAIGRTQDLIYHISQLIRDQRIRPTDVFIDSPMATAATRIYEAHPNIYDSETTNLIRTGLEPLDFPGLKFTRSRQESQALNDLKGGRIIIAGSGMCTGGRIVHHLRHSLSRPTTHIVFVGFQGRGTLGRALVDGAKLVHIFGQEIEVQAKIHTLGGFSAHSGQSGLLSWAKAAVSTAQQGKPPRLVLTHGEDEPRRVLADRLRTTIGLTAELPQWGDLIKV